MKSDLAIFHYHLFPGGVTSVVSLSVRAVLAHLNEVERITLVCGSEHHLKALEHHLHAEEPAARARVGFDVLPELFYLSREAESDLPDLEALKRTLRVRYGGAIWWVHNYHLGKNPIFTQALLEIAEESPDQRMIFHIHDFPECARYDNLAFLERFVTRPLYPVSRNVRYAVINNRDYALLGRSGVPAEQLFLLNNPVPGDRLPSLDRRAVRSRLEDSFADRFRGYVRGAPLLFYPVRTIRRKNVFEAGLLAAIAHEPANLLVTLPGISEREAPYSALVETSFARGEIPGMWGIGSRLAEAGIGFQALALSTDCVVSSSVQEGFGYLFIDGRRWRKPVFARYLDILDGIAEVIDGRSAYFYRELKVPATKGLRDELAASYQRKARAIGAFLQPAALESLEETIERTFAADTVDYSYLGVADQRRLLQRAADPRLRADLIGLNRDAVDALGRLMQSTPDDIGERIQEHFSLETFARRLEGLLESFDSAARGGSSPPPAERIERSLRGGFASLEYLRLLYE